ncbi:MAG: hypothetical protein IPM77_07335 [Crocinitomicaceae bacterium]|nr:hypothetical protein [Crocinitomicaceae bacterium]
MKSTIQHTKIELIQWLTTLEDQTILNKILALRKKETKDWWQNLSESEKESIEKGLKDAKNGKLKSHNKARKVYEKWL